MTIAILLIALVAVACIVLISVAALSDADDGWGDWE